MDVVKELIDLHIPLIRYAAQKALYILTDDEQHAQALIQPIEYGFDHHFARGTSFDGFLDGSRSTIPALDLVSFLSRHRRFVGEGELSSRTLGRF